MAPLFTYLNTTTVVVNQLLIIKHYYTISLNYEYLSLYTVLPVVSHLHIPVTSNVFQKSTI